MKTQDDHYIPDKEWQVIVGNVPIVSVDLVVICEEGVVLAKRQNEPAKNEWFVPGGRVRKHETLKAAVHRVAHDELGISVEILESLGSYEHFYEKSEINESGGKHYLANGYLVKAQNNQLKMDDQHTEIQIFEELPADLHIYVQNYLDDAGFIKLDNI